MLHVILTVPLGDKIPTMPELMPYTPQYTGLSARILTTRRSLPKISHIVAKYPSVRIDYGEERYAKGPQLWVHDPLTPNYEAAYALHSLGRGQGNGRPYKECLTWAVTQTAAWARKAAPLAEKMYLRQFLRAMNALDTPETHEYIMQQKTAIRHILQTRR